MELYKKLPARSCFVCRDGYTIAAWITRPGYIPDAHVKCVKSNSLINNDDFAEELRG